LALITFDNAVELWNTTTDRLTISKKVSEPKRACPLGSGLAVLAGGKLHVFDARGNEVAGLAGVGALAVRSDELIVGSDSEVAVLDRSGTRRHAYPAVGPFTAVGGTSKWLVAGRENGSLTLIRRGADRDEPEISFEGLPSSPAAEIIAGPAEIVIVGYADGAFGLWSLRTGARLYLGRLHGAIHHLLLERKTLYAVSDLGHVAVVDLSVFHRDYCEIMREIWADIPIVWKRGRAVRRAVPRDHACFGGGP
jgi:hypothetical protein